MMPCRLLLVDDEEEFAASLAKVLRRRGLAVEVANSGEAALVAVRERAFDVVVLDVKMPGKDGLHVLMEMKARVPGVEVILMTGHLSVDEEANGMDHGAFAYLLKPHPIDDLVEVIRAAASRGRGA